MKAIKTEQDYQAALKRVDALIDAPEDSPEMDELEVLGSFIYVYESVNYPIFTEDIDAKKAE